MPLVPLKLQAGFIETAQNLMHQTDGVTVAL